MTKANKGMNWVEVVEKAGDLPKVHARKPFPERAAEAEAWAREMRNAPAGIPIVRMGRPSGGEPRVVTEWSLSVRSGVKRRPWKPWPKPRAAACPNFCGR